MSLIAAICQDGCSIGDALAIWAIVFGIIIFIIIF